MVVTDTEVVGKDKWHTIMTGVPENTKGIKIPSVFVSRSTGERLWSRRLWPWNVDIRASLNQTGHVELRPPPIGPLETLGVYLLVSMLLVGFSGLCGVLVALAITW